MNSLAPILIPLLLAILYLFWRQVSGQSMDDLLDRSAKDHHRVHEVLSEHPDGGTWDEFQRWMAMTKQSPTQ